MKIFTILSKIPIFIDIKEKNMNEKTKKLLHLITMSVAAVAVIVYAIIYALVAYHPTYGALVMVMSGLMFIWAVCRVVVLLKEYKRSE